VSSAVTVSTHTLPQHTLKWWVYWSLRVSIGLASSNSELSSRSTASTTHRTYNKFTSQHKARCQQPLPRTFQATTYHTPHKALVNQHTQQSLLPAGREGSTKSPARCGGGSRSRTTAAGCVATHRRELKLLLTRQRRSKNGDLTNKRRDYKWLKSWAVDSHTDPEVSTLRILPAPPTYNKGTTQRSTVHYRATRCADT
jgi:hypothetical protein